MAKLSARGRKEVARVTKLDASPNSDLVTERRKTYALMTDGAILEKTDVVFKSDGKKHSYGWKVVFAKAGVTPEKFVSHYVARGYEVTR